MTVGKLRALLEELIQDMPIYMEYQNIDHELR